VNRSGSWSEGSLRSPRRGHAGCGRSSSEEVLRLADKLISEGHNPTHFARHSCVFSVTPLWPESPARFCLLQISGMSGTSRSHRGVVQRGDLHVICRSCSELMRAGLQTGAALPPRTRPPQMAHAQRLLPIEQLLSEAGGTLAAGGAKNPAKPSLVPESAPQLPRVRAVPTISVRGRLARKSGPKSSRPWKPPSRAPLERSRLSSWEAPHPTSLRASCRPIPQTLRTAGRPGAKLDAVRSAVLNALGDAVPHAGSMLETVSGR